MGHTFLMFFCVSFWEAVLLNCDRLGLHLEVILGAFCGTLATVKTVVLLRENIDFPGLGRSRWTCFSRLVFWRRPGGTFVDFGRHLGSQWEPIWTHFGAFLAA